MNRDINVFRREDTGNVEVAPKTHLVYLLVASGLTHEEAITRFDPRKNPAYSLLSDSDLVGYRRGQHGELIVEKPARDQYSEAEF